MWEFEGDHPGHWVPYDMEISACLEQAQLAGQQMLDMNTLFQLPYSIHFTTMQQVSWHFTPLPTTTNVALAACHNQTTGKVALHTLTYTHQATGKVVCHTLTTANVPLAAHHNQATGKVAHHTLTYSS